MTDTTPTPQPLYSILYHDSCQDGLAAAWVAGKALGKENCEFYAVCYGQPPPTCRGTLGVFVLDFCYQDRILKTLAKLHDRFVVVIDHHKSVSKQMLSLTQIDLAPGVLPWAAWSLETAAMMGKRTVYALFDENYSGAVLTWQFFFGDEPIPQILAYIQDRDLWAWKLPMSREINAGLRLQVAEYWDNIEVGALGYLDHLDDVDAQDFLTKCQILGAVICQTEKALVERIAASAVEWEVRGYCGQVVRSSVLRSELGEYLLEQHEYLDFAAILERKGQKEVVHLRSRKGGRCDVSVLAALMGSRWEDWKGGGGHREAAGFSIPVLPC